MGLNFAEVFAFSWYTFQNVLKWNYIMNYYKNCEHSAPQWSSVSQWVKQSQYQLQEDNRCTECDMEGSNLGGGMDGGGGGD